MIYLFGALIGYKIAGTALCAWFCWKISKMRMTPTYTYVMFFWAFTLMLISQFVGILYTKDIYGFLTHFPSPLVVFTQLLQVLIVGSFVRGFSIKYRYLVKTYPKILRD